MVIKIYKHVYFIFFLLSTFVGFTIMYIINFKKVKQSHDLQELDLFINGDCYHIHHYITCFVIIISLLIGYKLNSKHIRWLLILIGFLLGIAVEDLLYKDWLKIKNNCSNNKIIKSLSK